MSRRDKVQRARAERERFNAAMTASYERPRATIGCAFGVRSATIAADVQVNGYSAAPSPVVVARGDTEPAPLRRGSNPSAQRRAAAGLTLTPTAAAVAALPQWFELPARAPRSAAAASSLTDTARAVSALRADRAARAPDARVNAAGLVVVGAPARRPDDHTTSRSVTDRDRLSDGERLHPPVPLAAIERPAPIKADRKPRPRPDAADDVHYRGAPFARRVEGKGDKR